MSNINIIFANRLTKVREEKDLKLVEAADLLGINRSVLHKYENGVNEPSLSMGIKLAKFYDVSLDWLTGDTDDKTRYYK